MGKKPRTTTMNNILNNWRNEVTAGLQGYLDNADLTHMEGHSSPDELATDYIETELEGEWLNETDSWNFINNDEQIYLEMEAYCRRFQEERMSVQWETTGIEQVVGKWREFIARDHLTN